jgi:hypothetical protein
MYSQQESPARDRMRNTLRVGDAARRTRTVTVRDIELFTELTGDRNPRHGPTQIAQLRLTVCATLDGATSSDDRFFPD